MDSTTTDTRECPACKSEMETRMDAKGQPFWGCKTFPTCKRAFLWGSPQDVAQGLLARYESKDGKIGLLATKLRDLLRKDPAKALPKIVGDLTPEGLPTFETITARIEGFADPQKRDLNIPKQKGNVKKWGERVKVKSLSEARKGIKPYDLTTRPSEPLIVLRQGASGGLCRPSSDFKLHKIQFPELNPIQSLVLQWAERDVNLVIAAPTSAGKTVMAEMVMAHALEHGAKAGFLSPLRAVSQEKYDDWTAATHPWTTRKVEIITGDYQLTEARKASLRESDVIVMTSEMLDSKTRRMASEGNDWLLRMGCLVVDEAHLLTMEDRGDALECGLMRFTVQNPEARIVLLSATMPNVEALGRWLTKLNGKPTVVLVTEWRPTTLTVCYPEYKHIQYPYSANEQSKFDAAFEILSTYPDDRFLVFVHSKKAGYQLLNQAKKQGYDAEFHSADLERDQRLGLERRFREGNLRVVICTSTLAYGINMPARRVIVVGVHRGMEEVDPIDVKQMVGRAGRLGLDPEGDAYVLVPDRSAIATRQRFSTVGPIESCLPADDTVAFHLTAEVAEGEVSTPDQAEKWYSRSFAALTGEPPDDELGSTMDRLSKVGILRQSGLSYEATALGRVASWLYFSPFDVADWCSNFRKLIELDKLRDDDALAWALGCVKTSFKRDYIPKEHQDDSQNLSERLRRMGIEHGRLSSLVLATEGCLKNIDYDGLVSQQRGLFHDADRVAQALSMIDKHVLKSLGPRFPRLLALRVQYRVGWDEAALCEIPGIGGKRAQLLSNAGLRSVDEVLKRPDLVRRVLGGKIAERVVRSAKDLVRRRQK